MDKIVAKTSEETKVSPSDEPIAYNMFLYRKRQELKLSRFKFARRLHILAGRYRLIENGYIMPSKKESARISEALGIDYESFLTGTSSFPEELPEKKRNRITAWFYHLLSAKWLRISLGALVALCVAGCILGNARVAYVESHQTDYYETSYVQFAKDLSEQGIPGISFISEWGAPEISSTAVDPDTGTKTTFIVTGSTQNYLRSVNFDAFRWTDEYRVTFQLLSKIGDEYSFRFTATDYTRDNAYHGYAFHGPSSMVVLTSKDGSLIDVPSLSEDDKARMDALTQAGKDFMASYDFGSEFINVINSKLGYSFTDFQKDVFGPKTDGAEAVAHATTVWGFIGFFAIFGILGSLFLFSYAMIYGQHKEKATPSIGHSDELLGFPRFGKPIKTNWRFGPFLPETFFEILGILLVALGGIRIIYYVATLTSPALYSGDAWQSVPAQFLGIYFLGMFLLYFIDFDLFLDDRRVYRNIVLYFLGFVGLYIIEANVMSALQDSGSMVMNMIYDYTNVLIPNNFMSATCYFLTMFFLFFTPKFIKTKPALIVFRSMAALPLIYTIVAFIIGNGDYFFGWEMNLWVKFWFKVERLPYSILCFSYLIGLFFLRLIAKARFGEEGAKRYIQGNRFLFLKNIMLCVIIVIVWVIELCYSGDKDINRLGIGINTSLIILVPFLLFYHPHKGPRNLLLDYTTLGFYGLAMVWPYVIALIIILSSGIWVGLLF